MQAEVFVTTGTLVITHNRSLQSDLAAMLRLAKFRVEFWKPDTNQLQAADSDVYLFGPDIETAQLRCHLDAAPSGTIAYQFLSNPTPETRFTAIKAGLQDILDLPLDVDRLKASIANCLRQRTNLRELERTSQTLGSLRDPDPLHTPSENISVKIFSNHPERALGWKATINRSKNTQCCLRVGDINIKGDTPHPDIFVLEATPNGIQTLRNLTSEPELRHIPTIMVAEGQSNRITTQAIDLGISDIICEGFAAQEFALRAQRALKSKVQMDRMRACVQLGLRDAIVDPLTGLYNRRYAMAYLKSAFAEPQTQSSKFALMMLDIDHFKQINDAHGHGAGDQVLAAFARRIKGNLRTSDMFARVGGEEFIIALPDTLPHAAQQAAERIIFLANDQPYTLDDGKTVIDLTVSIGLTFNTSHETSVSEDDTESAPCNHSDQSMVNLLVERADKAMYRAKDAGRNTVAVDQSAA